MQISDIERKPLEIDLEKELENEEEEETEEIEDDDDDRRRIVWIMRVLVSIVDIYCCTGINRY